ncbi:LOW QUALITY PROTEIN: hypothetical protein DH2020_044927 [Rehmannia glutinosa]|uniref:WRKY19-like zinc finger domain-containing protein n=1 Tax=Rehmannia glutinosa TaxID=99300 RepID=A0ABR0UFI9_REHGL
MYSAFFSEFAKNGNVGDTTLRLDGFGYGTRETATFGNSQTNSGGRITCTNAPDDACKLVLGLGPTPSAYSDEYSPSGSNKDKPMTTILNQELSSQRDSILKLGLSGGTDAVSNFSSSTHGPFDANRNEIPVADEGSTSAKKSGGYMTRLILAPRMENPEFLWTTEHGAKSHCQISQMSSEPSAVSNYSMSAISEPGSAAVSSDHRGSNIKKCKFADVQKGHEVQRVCASAMGADRDVRSPDAIKERKPSGLLQSPRRRAKRCGHPGGCTKAARGRSGLCIKHGGGKRCKVEGCARSAEGQIGLCISRGGGQRCQFLGCTKGAQGSTVFCKAHGGGKRCVFADARKAPKGVRLSAKGTVAGKRCMFDGGGICPKSVTEVRVSVWPTVEEKRCAVPGCTKSARGRTDCCVKHGGGSGASLRTAVRVLRAAPISARPRWRKTVRLGREGKCEKFARGKSGLCAAHTSMPSGVSVVSDSIESLEKPATRQQLIPPQVLVPLSMKVSSFYSKPSGSEKQAERDNGVNNGRKSLDFVVPEGRVHGGGLLSLLGGNINNAIDGM